MSSTSSIRGPGYIKQAWYKWKSVRLPWRRQFLVGADLAGNTFWEFRDAINAGRWRRIVKYTTASPHYADVKISPQWHGWLRYTREQAPTIQEQQYEVSRQANMKQLAAKADERWNSVPSFLDSPNRGQPVPAIGVGDSKPDAPPGNGEDMKSAVGDQQEVAEAVQDAKEPKKGRQENPWKRQRQGMVGEDWQPQSWSPGAAQRR
ncbi:hypothetical protein LTR37_007746 [Vermiconidia calcicola]|uniref:Uncharacterized protein n=1 Tax=Vermiconidia calcicola TaxID=1690605 RepID=A0ACC3NCT7_9PEZI|nr:hypothetical protein LTR37_007746 [Vermiconidia calcicola]